MESSSLSRKVNRDQAGISRQIDRRLLRKKAEGGLLGILGVPLSRSDRRLVGRAYANAAYRRSQELSVLSHSKYAFFKGQPVTFNEALISWIAKGEV